MLFLHDGKLRGRYQLMLIRARCRITTAAIGFVLLWSLTVIARGDTNLPPPRGHVNDFAGVLDDASRERLENILENLQQRTGIDFVIATVKHLDLFEPPAGLLPAP